jgi:hypothetical protein
MVPIWHLNLECSFVSRLTKSFLNESSLRVYPIMKKKFDSTETSNKVLRG